MRIYNVGIVLCFVFIILSLSQCEAEEFESITAIDQNLYSVTVSINHGLYFVGSDRTLFRSKDNLNDWQAVYTIKGDRTKINHIYALPLGSSIYVATSSGLLKSNDQGMSFTKIFRGHEPKQKVVNHVKVKDNTIYIGTANGLFLSSEDNLDWRKSRTLPEDIEVYWIEFDPTVSNLAYLATSLGVYKTEDNFKSFTKIFSVQRANVQDSEDTVLVEESDYYAFLPKVLIIDKKYNELYLGTSDGLFTSLNEGKNWQKKFTSTLGRASIRNIYQDIKDYDVFFIATDSGFYRLDLDSGLATQLYKGLTTNDIRDMVLYSDGKFLLATDKGLFVSKDYSNNNNSESILTGYEEYFKYEPSIGEVRNATIEYNDISSQKVQRWRELSTKKAMFPTLSVGADRNVTDLHHWDSGQNPDVITKGEDSIEWDISLTWDLGDLIWSTDQTSIDVRSRLNTQLRIDILEEVNRLYFERYRLKLELLSSPTKDPKVKIEKQLRLKEMTAALDYYTGGFFSSRIRQLKIQDSRISMR